jgi:hypothetical protein
MRAAQLITLLVALASVAPALANFGNWHYGRATF